MATRTSFSCGESLDITAVHALQKRLDGALKKSSTIELKADAVHKADTAGLQLMLSLAQEVERQGGRIIWKKPTNALISYAQQLGLAKPLGLD